MQVFLYNICLNSKIEKNATNITTFYVVTTKKIVKNLSIETETS
jgi:hypothetical protein